MKPTKHYSKEMEEEGGNGDVMEGVNLFKIPYMHVWNYYNEPLPHSINVW
jgi:hypothetical protein